MRFHSTLLFTVALLSTASLPADEPLFSGPQVGEKLPEFKVRGVFGTNAGADLNFVKEAAGKPIVLVFIHDTGSRQPLQFAKVLANYTTSLASSGLRTGVIWLSDEAPESEARLRKIGYALCREAPTGISLDGKEGPGSYGLNRSVTMTILVGKDGKVTANFALIQASLIVELPKILKAIATTTGAPEGTLDDLLVINDEQFTATLQSLVDRHATMEEVDRLAESVEKSISRNEGIRRELVRLVRHLNATGQLQKHGTPQAQAYLQKWASTDPAGAKSTTPEPDTKK